MWEVKGERQSVSGGLILAIRNSKRLRVVLASGLAVAGLALAAAAPAQAGTFTAIPSYVDPLGGRTSVLGINNAGWMAGSISTPAGGSRGFSRDAGGAYTTFSVDVGTVGRAIDETNRVSGYATDSTGSLATDREFIRDAGGAVTILQNPATSANLHGIAQGMNASGAIVGDYLLTGPTRRHGFILQGGALTDLAVPGFPLENVRARAITDAGTVAGWAQFTGSAARAFILSGGSYQFFDAPGAVNGTFFEDLNNFGLVAGEFSDAAFNMHAFTYNTVTSVYTSLDVAGATNTQTFGLNDFGYVVLTTDIATGDSNFLYRPGGVPEPSTWALMIGGFGLAGTALRRRRSAALTA